MALREVAFFDLVRLVKPRAGLERHRSPMRRSHVTLLIAGERRKRGEARHEAPNPKLPSRASAVLTSVRARAAASS
jgi:hypothetical protein